MPIDKTKQENIIHRSSTHWPLLKQFHGVHPIASAREHTRLLPLLCSDLLGAHAVPLSAIACVAVTYGPGLAPCLTQGLEFASSLVSRIRSSTSSPCPYYPVNHLLGHSLIAGARFPYLTLIVSGGHSELQFVRSLDDIEIIGEALDDSAGEAFDKVARALGASAWRGHTESFGAALEKKAAEANGYDIPPQFVLPEPLEKRGGFDFSFSGLKSATVNRLSALAAPTNMDRAFIAASFQRAVGMHLATRTKRAVKYALSVCPDLTSFVLCGGVAANEAIKASVFRACSEAAPALECRIPPKALCNDNAIMIGAIGVEYYLSGRPSSPLAVHGEPRLRSDPRPRQAATIAKPRNQSDIEKHVDIIKRKMKRAELNKNQNSTDSAPAAP